VAENENSTETVTKRKVTLTNSTYVGTDADGNDIYQRAQMVDYVPDDVREGVNVLQAYLAAVRPAWASVVVSDEYDAGPGGYHGQTHIADAVRIPAIGDEQARAIPVEHPLAGHTFEATEPAPTTEDDKPSKGGAGKVATFLTVQLGLGMLLLSLAALVQTATRKNLLAAAYAADSVSVALFSTTPSGTAGTELTGGTPAYARITPAWGAASGGVVSTSAMTFNVASGSTVAGFGVYNASAVYQDGAGLTSQAFASQGTYALTLTYTQT